MIKRFSSIVVFLFIIIPPACADELNIDSLFRRLTSIVDDKDYYMNRKEGRIKNLKELLKTPQLRDNQKYEINSKLYQEYKKYNLDTALHYLEKNKEIATQIQNKALLDETTLQIVDIYSSKSLFVESYNILNQLNPKDLSADLLEEYYRVYGYFTDRYGQNNEEYKYYEKSDLYRDSLLSVTKDILSMKYQILLAQDMFYKDQSEPAKEILLTLLQSTTDNDPERAAISYWLSVIYDREKSFDMEEKYLIISAICDITNAIKDNASLQRLAILYSERGDIDKAYKFITLAMDDAVQCNVKYRASEAMKSYPIINAAYQDKEARQKKELRIYLIFISILAIILGGAMFYIYAQMKRVSRIRKELYHSSVKLIELNQDIKESNKKLHDTNIQLIEANHVKEEYIVHFFNMCSEYIHKLDEYRKSLNKLATKNAMAELCIKLKSTTMVDSELQEFYKRFDNIFLNLFPTFVSEFNALLIEEEQFKLKNSELLNPELRIFALIRLGITDSVKIASFLRYSLNTIYNYRTKIRNKAAVSRDSFEKMVMKIGVIDDQN